MQAEGLKVTAQAVRDRVEAGPQEKKKRQVKVRKVQNVHVPGMDFSKDVE
jgi:hypothetical protein